MDIKLEQIEKEIAQTEQNLEQAKASANVIAGALMVLKNIREHLKKDEPKPEEPRTDISEANKAVQDELEAKQAEKVADAYGKYVEKEVANG